MLICYSAPCGNIGSVGILATNNIQTYFRIKTCKSNLVLVKTNEVGFRQELPDIQTKIKIVYLDDTYE